MAEGNVRSVGRCAGCQKMSALEAGACPACTKRFGPRFGAMASRVRAEPEFRLKCFLALKSDLARAEFVRTFGPGEVYTIGRGQ